MTAAQATRQAADLTAPRTDAAPVLSIAPALKLEPWCLLVEQIIVSLRLANSPRTLALTLCSLLLGCTAQQADIRASSGEYGPLRRPSEFGTGQKDEPVIPPAAPAAPLVEDKPKPAAPDCDTLCAAFREENSECASRTVSCQRLLNAGFSDENDTCRARNSQCKRADRAEKALGKCRC